MLDASGVCSKGIHTNVDIVNGLTYRILKIKVKKRNAIPVTGRGGLLDSEMLRIPHCLDNLLTDVIPTHRPRSTPQKHYFHASGTHFC
jgi:hypothetical protein